MNKDLCRKHFNEKFNVMEKLKPPPFKKLADILIILFFVSEIFYSAYQILFVFRPKEAAFILFSTASEIPHEYFLARRLYAFEFYLAIIGLILYLAFRDKILKMPKRSE